MKKTTWIAIGVGVILIIGASIVYSQNVAKKANEGVEVQSHVKGNPDASVVLIEYSDFECPACAQFYPYVQEIVANHSDALRFEYRHFPLVNIHRFAHDAAVAAEAAGQQGKFFEMHDMLFENQTTWAKSSAPRQYFMQYAEELELDIETFKRHLGSSLLAQQVDDGFDDARSRGFTGTPTFLLNDEVMDFGTFDEFREQIETAIANAQQSTE